MAVDDLLYEMEENLESGFGVPFGSGKRVVEVDKIRSLIDEIRRGLPAEVKQATAIVNDRKDIIATANKEAQIIIQRAEERARAIINESDLVVKSKKVAAEIEANAKKKAREISTKCMDACENMLKSTESVLIKNANDAKNARTNLRKMPNNE